MRLSRFGLAAALLGLAAQAQIPPQIPRAVLFGNPERSAPQLSPDGKKMAYLAPDKGVLNVWVKTLGQADDKAITSDKKRGVRSYFWQQDSAHLLYVQDQDGDENWHLYQTDLKTGMTRDLTPFKGITAQIVAMDEKHPDTLLVGINNRDPRLHDVYRLNLKNGALDLDTQNPGDVLGFEADHTLTVRGAQVMKPDGSTEIRVRDDAKSPWRVFMSWSADETNGGVASFTPDNKGLWVMSSVGANATRLIQADLATGKQTVVSEDPMYDLSGLLVHPTRNTLEAVNYTKARREWVVLDKAVQPDFDAIRKVREGDFGIVSRDQADKTWLVAYTTDDGPVYWYSYDRATRKADLLFSNQPKLEGAKLAKMQPVSFKAQDGMTIHGYLTLPVGVPAKNLPLIVNVHGGPWARDTWGYRPEVQWMANRGYAVLQVNFRGSTGYGKAYLNAGDKEWGRKMHQDLLDGRDWVVKQGIADPKKVAIYGGSYGGYATLAGLAFTPTEFTCGVDIVGPSNLATLLASIPPYWAPMKAMFTKRMGETEAILKERSPLYKAGDIVRPLLIAQGANDPRVKQAESDQIVAAMRKNGQTVDYLLFPDEGHGFARPENRMKFYAAAEAFLARHLGGRVEAPLAAEVWDALKK
ncbi:MAG TPA: S9 family peptidase [Holophagaceae bacterium]|jgi:dipeptidyl aminopeptidase/acylaminoacyl peptidase|nr:S9 family peptidase [Holophagaceae bacterium]